MANYTGPDPNRLLPGEPWTSDIALAAFEDAVAIAEGAPGAPRNQPRSLGGLILPAFSAAENNWAGLVDLDDFNELTIHAHGGGAAGGVAADVLEIRFSNSNGATWSAVNAILNLPSNESFNDYFTMRVNLDTGANTRMLGIRGVLSTAFTLPTGTVNGFQIRGNGSGIRATAVVTGGRA